MVTYRIKRLQEQKIILDFTTEIDISKLGYFGAAIFVDLKHAREKEFKQYLRNCGFVSWVAELSGIWNYGLSVFGRSTEELDQRFQMLYSRFAAGIRDHRFTLHKQNTFFYEKYLGGTALRREQKNIPLTLDQRDKLILKELAHDSRSDDVRLAQKVGLTAPAVAARVKKLEHHGFIRRYSLLIDVSKIGLIQYGVFIVNKNRNDREKLLAYLSAHHKISYTAEYIGDAFLEFGIIVENPYQVRRILQEIEETFPDNRIIELFQYQEDLVSVGPPDCMFE